MKIGLSGRKIWLKRILFYAIFILFSLLFVVCAATVLVRFNTVFIEKASHEAKVQATRAINSAVTKAVSDMEQTEFMHVNSDLSGNISSLTADMPAMNLLRAKILEYSERNTSTLSKIYVPMGSLTKFSALQGVGCKIPVKICADGIIEADFAEEFTDAGINQVKHKVYLNVSANISIISYTLTKSETITVTVPIAETITVGEIPRYYGGGITN